MADNLTNEVVQETATEVATTVATTSKGSNLLGFIILGFAGAGVVSVGGMVYKLGKALYKKVAKTGKTKVKINEDGTIEGEYREVTETEEEDEEE